MKVIENRTIYKCDFCRKNYLTKAPCVRHETYCSKNPANKHACYYCHFLEVDREQTEEGNFKTFTCSKLDKQMHTVKAEKMGHSCLEYTERMPLECNEFKGIWDLIEQ